MIDLVSATMTDKERTIHFYAKKKNNRLTHYDWDFYYQVAEMRLKQKYTPKAQNLKGFEKRNEMLK